MSERRPFTKMQAIGNDFVVFDERDWPDDTDWHGTALRVCDRNFGVGSDGLLVVGESIVADVRMRMFNPDGSEDMCGNGLRCVVKYSHNHGRVAALGAIEAIDGVHRFRVDQDAITTVMLPPLFHLPEIPVAVAPTAQGSHREQTNLDISVGLPDGELTVDAVNTGSTHAVIFRKALPDDKEFFSLSPLIEQSPVFPERTSVLWAVVEGPRAIRLRIWERGVGETLGCGTGACAAAVLATMRGLIDAGPVSVISAGGELSVYWSGQAGVPVTLSGTAQIVYAGMVRADA